MTATRLVTRARRALGAELSIQVLFEAAAADGLAGWLVARGAELP